MKTKSEPQCYEYASLYRLSVKPPPRSAPLKTKALCGYIYFVDLLHGRVKIGASCNPVSRISGQFYGDKIAAILVAGPFDNWKALELGLKIVLSPYVAKHSETGDRLSSEIFDIPGNIYTGILDYYRGLCQPDKFECIALLAEANIHAEIVSAVARENAA